MAQFETLGWCLKNLIHVGKRQKSVETIWRCGEKTCRCCRLNNQIAKNSFRVFPYGFWIVNGDLSVDQETISEKLSNKPSFEMAELGNLSGASLARDDSEGAIPSARHEGRMRSDMEQG